MRFQIQQESRMSVSRPTKTDFAKIDDAVIRSHGQQKQKLLDRAFALAFRGLVYAQIWEDPVVDMEALAIQPGNRVATIASGGCNVLSYLTADPGEIVAVDLNTAHIALNRLKVSALEHLPDYRHFRRFFADADTRSNLRAYKAYVSDHLDETSKRYWERRDLIGRRRIGGFASGVYKRGLLGSFIGLAHAMAKIYRIDPRDILQATSIEEQQHIFENRFAPLFDRKFVRWLTDQPASLFGLGIPPAQFDALAGDQQMADVLKERLRKLACGFDLKDNYFAWQAFGRGYGKGEDMPLPPYLQEANYAAVKARANRIDIRHANLVEMLAKSEVESFDRYILLDAQDWMDDAQLTQAWFEITRTARPGARVLFRTAAEPSLLPGRVPDDILSMWHYEAQKSLDYTRRDRSAIYGGVHLYVLKG
jgi:S-adenosylmethionine-diacylglycerol 3-amino-3-carboxypropyl transferase